MAKRINKIPSSNWATKQVTDLGPQERREYIDLREKYKGEGLTPKEAKDRAYIELRIGERWMDWKRRQSMQVVMGKHVPLTPDEMKAVSPNYRPPGVMKAEEVGDADMTLAEDVRWAKEWAARVQNGEDPPVKFPSKGALFWYQSAVANRREFEKVVLRVESPAGEGDNVYLQDSQYQFSQIEKEIQEAVREVGASLLETEAGFAEQLGRLLEPTEN